MMSWQTSKIKYKEWEFLWREVFGVNQFWSVVLSISNSPLGRLTLSGSFLGGDVYDCSLWGSFAIAGTKDG